MKIPVFYSPHMHTAEAQGYSPSAGKPKLVVEDWRHHFGENIEVIASTPAKRADIKLAHDPRYVDGVMGSTVPNGFGNTSTNVAATLPYTTGSLLSAAKHVLSRHNRPVAVSPTSGFHHAHYSAGGGFCTFNGLVITAMKLKAMGLVEKIGILDMDQHYGDGTDDIIERLKLDFIIHITAGKGYQRDPDIVDGLHVSVKKWFARLGFGDPSEGRGGILLYQAGADAHVDDPLGGWLTTEQMRERDKWVFRICRMYGIPLVWNLAGGYQRDESGSIAPVLELHCNTMRECINEFSRYE